MVFADFEYHEFPIVTINFYEKPIDENEFNEYIRELSSLLLCCSKYKSKCCLVFNCIEMREKIPITYANKQATYLKNNKNLIINGLSASSIIGPGWVKPLLKVIFSINPPIKPYLITKKIEKGLLFASSHREETHHMINKDDILDEMLLT